MDHRRFAGTQPLHEMPGGDCRGGAYFTPACRTNPKSGVVFQPTCLKLCHHFKWTIKRSAMAEIESKSGSAATKAINGLLLTTSEGFTGMYKFLHQLFLVEIHR